jgi:hypothetical protein
VFSKLIQLLKEKKWEYQVLRNGVYQKEAIYFVLGNEEILIFKNDHTKCKRYIDIIENW